GHDRVVEARLDVGDPVGDVLADPAARASTLRSLWLRHPADLLGGGRLALAGDAHLPRPLAGARVGLGPLAAGGPSAPVAVATVGADLGQPLDVLRAL